MTAFKTIERLHLLIVCVRYALPLQDEKNQVLITNAWLQLVGLLSPPPKTLQPSPSRDQCGVGYFWKALCLSFATCGCSHPNVPALDWRARFELQATFNFDLKKKKNSLF